MGAEPVVVAEHVTKSYGAGDAAVLAVDDVSLQVQAGEFVLVRGPSGSGKTTLLHCLSGIATVDAGRVRLDGTDIASLDDDARADLRAHQMGFVFQRFNLLPALTVAENVELPMVLLGWERARIEQRRAELLQIVGLTDKASASPDHLSGGQQQLAALARAIAIEPRIVWADEPTGALDSGAAEHVLRALRALVDQGATLLLVSHDPTIATFATRVVTMRDGALEP